MPPKSTTFVGALAAASPLLRLSTVWTASSGKESPKACARSNGSRVTLEGVQFSKCLLPKYYVSTKVLQPVAGHQMHHHEARQPNIVSKQLQIQRMNQQVLLQFQSCVKVLASVTASVEVAQACFESLDWASHPEKPQVRPRVPRLDEGRKYPPRILASVFSAANFLAKPWANSMAKSPTPTGTTPSGSNRVTATPSIGLYVTSSTDLFRSKSLLSPLREPTAAAMMLQKDAVAAKETPMSSLLASQTKSNIM